MFLFNEPKSLCLLRSHDFIEIKVGFVLADQQTQFSGSRQLTSAEDRLTVYVAFESPVIDKEVFVNVGVGVGFSHG